MADLLKRFLFSIVALSIYRLGTYVTIPGVDVEVLKHIVGSKEAGFFDIFNTFSGGALGRMTIFALNVMPYIVSSIIIQLLSVSFSKLNSLRHEGDLGRKKINFYTRCLTVFFCVVQSIFIVLGLESMSSLILPDFSSFFLFIAVSTLLGGTMFLLWLGEQITVYGIGNGISLIIVTGILAELPNSLAAFFLLGKVGGISIAVVLAVSLLFIFLLWGIIFVEQSYRKILIQYPRKQVGNKIYANSNSYIPIKLNMSGVIPPIFANALLLFPATIMNFLSSYEISSFISLYFMPGGVLYTTLYLLFIVFFSFFYVGVVFNVEETADNLKKQGGFVVGKRPGKDTIAYFRKVINRVTFLGSCYLAIICVVPEVIRTNYSMSFAIGGTSLLIIVNVLIDVFSQIQSYQLTRSYSSLSVRFKGEYSNFRSSRFR